MVTLSFSWLMRNLIIFGRNNHTAFPEKRESLVPSYVLSSTLIPMASFALADLMIYHLQLKAISI
jgi:hypothetical protein